MSSQTLAIDLENLRKEFPKRATAPFWRRTRPEMPLLVLDEPTIGLDPQAARNFRDLLRTSWSS